ncbi:hypothetical protein STIP28_53 [Synechococcus T7-like virus S-TIP28]|uniref:Uncharacterized protein n=1 Tax=Synechococcus T7-like virus S-TIP28 TaxID=1332140 RepID=A0AAE8XJ71_9CAUD|nr:hypothetical protein STIP28_53 [Synechococcus T7-like virus S-TIP28]
MAAKRKITEATRRARRKYNATPKAKKRRAALNKINRQKGTYGNGDGLDNSHTSRGRTVKEKASANRRRNGRNGKSKYKR